jgi:hypothetical protein
MASQKKISNPKEERIMPGVKLINPVTPPRMKEITWWGSPSNQYHWDHYIA